MAKSAVKIDKVSFKYRDSDVFAIKNISMDVAEGDFVLLVGHSGSGKSTLLKCINNLIPYFHSGAYAGKVFLQDEEIGDAQTALLAKQIGFVFQNPENQLSALTVEREIAFPLENFGIPREEIIKRVDEIVNLLNLHEIRYKSPFNISGGEQQLTAIAAALALDPPILVLDEVTANLSPKSAQKILTILKNLNKDFGKTIIISEHRLDRCIDFVNKIACLVNTELKVFNETKLALTDPKYPQELLPKIPSLFFQLKEKLGENTLKRIMDEDLPLTPAAFVKAIKLPGETHD
ncbi:MAG: ABC transporter ATP-binding protein [Candidatus Heimdallarchaeota archaeon]